MLNPDTLAKLKKLEDEMRYGTLTPTTYADEETIVCFTEVVKEGIAYHQGPFEVIRLDLRAAFRSQKKGFVVGAFKIVAIFDKWPEEPFKPVRAPITGPTPKRYVA